MIEAAVAAAALAGTVATEVLVTTAAVAVTAGTIMVAGKVYERVDALVNTNRLRKSEYYAAYRDKRTNAVYIFRAPISYNQAMARVATGKDVYIYDKSKAESLAATVGGRVVGPERHIQKDLLGAPRKGVYYWHYHTCDRKPHSHVFFGDPVIHL